MVAYNKHMQHIYIVRHGQTRDNAYKIVSGSHETPLTELGREQAAQAGEHAKGLNVDLIVASPLGRAQTTAKIIADVIGYPPGDIVTMPELSERDLGKLEGTSYATNPRLNGNFPAVEHIVGVEPLAQFHSRVQHALRQLMHDKKHHCILVVSHFGVGHMLRTIVEGKKPIHMYDQPHLNNGAIYPLL
jgi:uncharacterized phosphatase